jgi:hypothetical protein
MTFIMILIIPFIMTFIVTLTLRSAPKPGTLSHISAPELFPGRRQRALGRVLGKSSGKEFRKELWDRIATTSAEASAQL